jgi:hypothetical protein
MLHKNRTGRVAQGEGPEFNPQYHKQNKTKKTRLGFLVLFFHRPLVLIIAFKVIQKRPDQLPKSVH